LSGLIDSDGDSSKQGCIQIPFHANEVSVALLYKKSCGV